MKHVKILIVDDTTDCRKLLRILLNSLISSLEIVEAIDGADATEILEKDQNFDLIICDYTMPKLSGASVYKYVNERQLTIPFILFTVLYEYDLNDFVGPAFMGVVQKHDLPGLQALIAKAGLVDDENETSVTDDLTPVFS